MPTVIPNFATILSIFPIALEAVRRHNGMIPYQHPAVSRDGILVRTYNPEVLANTNRVPEGTKLFSDESRPSEATKGYALIRVCDTFTWARDFTQDKERFFPHPVPARDVAEDLHRAWASDAIEADGNAGPGMTVIAGDEPTADELEFVREKQTTYFRRLVVDGHTMHSRGQLKDISDLHRAGATWMGANNLPWLPKLEQVQMKPCPACANEIRAMAVVCQFCNQNLPDFYLKYGIVPDPLVDAAVVGVLANIEKLAAAKKGKAA